MIDTHLHLWDLAAPPAWLSPELGPLFRTYDPAAARQMHLEHGYTQAVAVQVDDTRADTTHMLNAARNNPWIVGVVGWVDLTDPAAAAADLQRLGTTVDGRGLICGIRHLVHADPRENFLDLPSVRESLGILASASLPLDVPDAFPRHLRQLIDLASELPELTVVVDHLGKPPVDSAERREWRAQLRDASGLPNVVAKISGLHHGGIPLPAAISREVMDFAFEEFTANRLMLGSDWPMPLLGEGMAELSAQRDRMLAMLDAQSRAEITHRSAMRIYHLDYSKEH